MDEIKSNSRFQSGSSIMTTSKKYEPSKDTIILEEEDILNEPNEKIPEYQLAEMQRRKKHFDEFKKLYNNKLEEKEARKRAEEAEQHDAFLQHPITKLLSKYGFKVPKSKMSVNSVRSQRISDFRRSRLRGSHSRSRSGSGSSGRSEVLRSNDSYFEPAVSFSDMEIVDIYQRHAQNDLNDRHVKISTDSFYDSADRKDEQTEAKLREEIAELEQRFNYILKSFKSFPHGNKMERNQRSGDTSQSEE